MISRRTAAALDALHEEIARALYRQFGCTTQFERSEWQRYWESAGHTKKQPFLRTGWEILTIIVGDSQRTFARILSPMNPACCPHCRTRYKVPGFEACGACLPPEKKPLATIELFLRYGL